MTKKKTKIIGIGIVAVLLIGLIPIVSGEDILYDVYIVEEGGKDLSFLQKFLSGFYIYGASDIQLGKGSSRSGDPPVLNNPSTNFKLGETVGCIFTARNVKGGGNIEFYFCEGSSCNPANIFYKSGSYTNRYEFSGDWDVWWIVTAFSAKEEGTLTLRVIQSGIIASKTFTVQGMVCSPNTKICDSDFAKTCKSDGSGWTSEYCWYGCSNGYCSPKPPPTPTPDPCLGVICPDKCVGDTLYYSGYCQYGSCQYNMRFCQYGCSGSRCNSAPIPTSTPTLAPTPTPPAYPPRPAGFESIFAIAGFLAVAYLIIRRRK